MNIIIAGASGEIGRAITRFFLKKGNRLLLLGCKNKAELEALQAEGAEKCAYADILCADLSTAEGIDQAAKKALSMGSWDILINGAGISVHALFQDTSREDYERILATNLSSTILLTKALLPGFIRQQSGRIINLSSVWGNVGASMEVEYSVTKAGINGFTKALAKELAPSGIAVNAIAPGLIDTRMNGYLTPEDRKALTEEIPAGRMGTPEEVGQTVYLLSEAPLYLTGQIITLDGGWT